MIYHLHRKTLIAAPIDMVWDFIATPKNLNRITPKNMSFKIMSDVPNVMYEGLLIEYLVSIPLFGQWRWLTEIKHIRPGQSFVDEQRSGPYKFWYHYHELHTNLDGTEMFDSVTYQLPYWLMGDLVNAMIVKRQLEEIFNFREQFFNQMTNQSTQ